MAGILQMSGTPEQAFEELEDRNPLPEAGLLCVVGTDSIRRWFMTWLIRARLQREHIQMKEEDTSNLIDLLRLVSDRTKNYGGPD